MPSGTMGQREVTSPFPTFPRLAFGLAQFFDQPPGFGVGSWSEHSQLVFSLHTNIYQYPKITIYFHQGWQPKIRLTTTLLRRQCRLHQPPPPPTTVYDLRSRSPPRGSPPPVWMSITHKPAAVNPSYWMKDPHQLPPRVPWIWTTSEVALCPLLPWYCVKLSWNIWFRDYQHVFYLEKVNFHLGKDYFNLISPSI